MTYATPVVQDERGTPIAVTPVEMLVRGGDGEPAVPSSSNPLPTIGTQSATGTQSNVSGVAASTTLLAANASRRGATIWNDSSATLYVLLASGTASATVCSVKLIADAYYEVPAGYTGIIKGIWASATGSARVTELV